MAAWQQKFSELTAKSHTEQAVWWLNGFWAEGADKYAEELWTQVLLFQEIETGQKKLYGKRKVEVKEGCDLDEMQAHVFLERMGETLTVRALRARLKELDIDNNKKMCLSEYLLAKHKKTPNALVNSPQGDADPAKLLAAQKQLEAAQEALGRAQDAVAAQKAAEAALAQAERELEAAIAEIHKIETEFKAQCDKLEAIGNDANAGAVKKNKAKNELAQLKAEDPLPLRKAKITQEAALKRVQKQKVLAEEATAQAEQEAKRAEDAVAEAVEQINIVKNSGDGVAKGRVWWMEREVVEMRKYMPK